MTRLAGLLVALALLAVPATAIAAGPAQPLELRVADGDGWYAENDFHLVWDRLAGEPPAATSYLRIRDEAGNVVFPTVSFGWDRLIEHVRVPGPGRFVAEVWLEDAAGNVGPPAFALLAFDNVRPGPARLRAPSEWLAASEAAAIAVEPSAPWLLSGLAGYAFSVDRGGGSSPCASAVKCEPAEVTVGPLAGVLSPGTLPEGANFVRVLAVSGSGLRSVAAATAVVRVDATVPAVALAAADGWVSGPQRLVATAVDAHSGMSAAGPTGPFTAIAVDGGVPRIEPGSTVAVTVGGEGVHRVAFYARDAAGNVGEDRPGVATVRIDETPPRIAFVNSQDPGEPERIEATIDDPLSGPDQTRGSIGVRPAASHQRFLPLPTTVSDRRLRAIWDSDAFPPGVYEFRASAYDEAGNAGGSGRRANGERMLLSNPLKTPTRIFAGFGGRRLVLPRCERRADRRRCHRQEIEAFEARPTTRAVPYGRGIPYSGRLTTAGGASLGDFPVEIVESLGAGARPAQRTTVVRTGADGSFTLRLAPGPSRRIEAVYGGNRTLTRAGGGGVELRVQASVRMHPSATTVRIGGSPVSFRGRIADPASVPFGGLPVELQFRLPGREWAEFRTVQSNGSGRFRYAYSFSDDDSRGVRFQFRAFVAAAANWPYEPASSRPVFVTGK